MYVCVLENNLRQYIYTHLSVFFFAHHFLPRRRYCCHSVFHFLLFSCCFFFFFLLLLLSVFYSRFLEFFFTILISYFSYFWWYFFSFPLSLLYQNMTHQKWHVRSCLEENQTFWFRLFIRRKNFFLLSLSPIHHCSINQTYGCLLMTQTNG